MIFIQEQAVTSSYDCQKIYHYSQKSTNFIYLPTQLFLASEYFRASFFIPDGNFVYICNQFQCHRHG